MKPEFNGTDPAGGAQADPERAPRPAGQDPAHSNLAHDQQADPAPGRDDAPYTPAHLPADARAAGRPAGADPAHAPHERSKAAANGAPSRAPGAEPAHDPREPAHAPHEPARTPRERSKAAAHDAPSRVPGAEPAHDAHEPAHAPHAPAQAASNDAPCPQLHQKPCGEDDERSGFNARPHWRHAMLCGADVELSNFIEGSVHAGGKGHGASRADGTGYEASRALLREIRGLPVASRRHALSCRCTDCQPPAGSQRSRRYESSFVRPHGSRLWVSSDAPYEDPPYQEARYEDGRNGGARHENRRYGAARHEDRRHEPGSYQDGNDRRDGLVAGTLAPGQSDRLHAAQDGATAWGYGANAGEIVFDAQDWGRRYLPSNGGCVYIDLNHLELAIPEVTSARDHVAAWHAMLRIARTAMLAANDGRREAGRIRVLVNNSDGDGHSWGSHLSFLITRRTFDNLFSRKLHQLLWLAAYQVSSIVFTGQGKVGSENGRSAVDFQLSQRADFFEALMGEQTTYRRPLVNTRDEALCGLAGSGAGSGAMARLHVIFFDSTLCHVSSFLKVGVMQIILAMLEDERIDPGLALEDPLDALLRWSHDPTLSATAPIVSGQQLTAVELQLQFLEAARRFVDARGVEDVIPDCRAILSLWEDTLTKLRAGAIASLAPRLDWALKLSVLQEARHRRPDLGWQDPGMKVLDHQYSSLDEDDGLYWAYERSGLVERVVAEERIAWLVENPPETTRAWTRAMLLRRARPEQVEDVDWDRIRFHARGGGRGGPVLDMADPLAFSKAANEHLFRDGASLADILEGLGATRDGGSRADDSWARRSSGWEH